MARVVGVVMNNDDVLAVLEDGSAFFLVSDGAEDPDAKWVELPPIPRTGVAAQAEAHETRKRVEAAGLVVPEFDHG